ncbi:hypothetical protein ABK040_010861 [Willaertia magna]
MKSKLRIGLAQLLVTSDKHHNVRNAVEKINQLKELGAELVVLPECFNSPYGTQHFKEYAEDANNSFTLSEMSKVAQQNNIHLIAGSIPTVKNEKYYNSCFVFDNEGKRIGQYNKIHLFDIDVPNKITFKESDVLSAGNELLSFTIPETKITIGIGICFDIRFPELSQIYQANRNCNVLVFPGAFNLTTGPLHWQLLARARAVDNQLYTVLCSPARDVNAGYVAFGNSLVVNPKGEVIQQHDETEGISTIDIDVNEAYEFRNQIPSIHNKRLDLYETIKKQ